MNKAKLILLASAAAMLIGTGEADAHVQFYAGSAPTLCMPQRTVAAGQALSPYAVATRLTSRHYKVQAMHRHGSAYAVRAIGPHGSKVDMMVDGGSGTIIGLTVLAAATGNVISALTAQNAVYVDDLHPFGAVVPEVVYDSWDNVEESSWEVASAPTIAVQESYAAYRSAVPFNFVHMSRNGRSVALAPPKYRGFRLTNSRGQAIQSRMTRAEAVSQEAAYQSERVDQAEFDKEMAQEDAADANEQADQLQQQNDALSDEVDAQTQHADEVEQKNAELQQQLDQNGTGNQEVDDSQVDGGFGGDCGPSAPTCSGQTNPYYDGSDQGGAADTSDTDTGNAAAPTDNGGAEANTDTATPADNGGAGASTDTATPADNGGADQQEQTPQQEATPQDQGGDQQQQQAEPQDQGGGDQQQAEPQDQGGDQQAAPDQSGGDDQQMDQGGGGDDQGGGGDDSGGGGDDSGGGGDDGN